jgi:hypothetical protein
VPGQPSEIKSVLKGRRKMRQWIPASFQDASFLPHESSHFVAG